MVTDSFEPFLPPANFFSKLCDMGDLKPRFFPLESMAKPCLDTARATHDVIRVLFSYKLGFTVRSIIVRVSEWTKDEFPQSFASYFTL